jgi:hypothetical protein
MKLWRVLQGYRCTAVVVGITIYLILLARLVGL